jgi:polysaccharide export outer membrane protein
MVALMAALVAVLALAGGPEALAGDPAAAPLYRLGGGDEVRVTVFGEDDLTSTYTVDGSGRLALPLIGAVSVGGLTTREAEARIAGRFADGYLRQPRVALEVLNYRPFYILGEVQTPGAYAYAEGLTVMGAVALGGGFTYRADEDDIQVSRDGAAARPMALDAAVLPGDVIRVEQRFF